MSDDDSRASVGSLDSLLDAGGGGAAGETTEALEGTALEGAGLEGAALEGTGLEGAGLEGTALEATAEDTLPEWATLMRSRRVGATRRRKVRRAKTLVEKEIERVAACRVSEETIEAERRWKGRVEKRGTHKWDPKVVEEHAAVVAKIGLAILEGRREDGYTWQRFDRMNAKARIRNAGEPGPGAYRLSSGMGKQALSHTRSAPSFTMNPRTKAKGRFKVLGSKGTTRMRVMPRHLTGGKASTKPRRLPAAPSLTGTTPVLSRMKRAPASTLGFRPKERPPSPEVNTSNPPVTSSIGAQATAGKATAPRAAFSRTARAKTPELTFAPGPVSYNPHHEYLLKKAPAAVMQGWNKSSKPMVPPYDAAVGTYNLAAGMGRQPVAGLRTQPAHKFALQDDMPSQDDITFAQAQDRRQPAALRPVKLKTRHRLTETVSGTLRRR